MADSVLICGFGAFGEQHARAWRRLDPGIRLMVADPSEQARGKARQLGIAEEDLSDDPGTLMDRATIVGVVAPPALHLPLALQALEAGKAVMIEKPAVTTVDEAKQLVTAVGDVPVQIGMVLRAHPLVAVARKHLANGDIGELVAVQGDFSGWKRMRADSSLVENDGVHMLDIMRHLVGAPVEELEARSWSVLDAAIKDDIQIELRYANKVRGRLRLGVLAAGEVEDPFMPGALTNKKVTFIGRKGNITIDFNANKLTLAKVTYTNFGTGHHIKAEGANTELAVGATPEAILAQSFSMFLDAVHGGRPVMCNVTEGALELAATLVAVDTALSRGDGAPVRIDGVMK